MRNVNELQVRGRDINGIWHEGFLTPMHEDSGYNGGACEERYFRNQFKGWYIYEKLERSIANIGKFEHGWFEVDVDTVCLNTGIEFLNRDFNKRQFIFEGDIVEIREDDYRIVCQGIDGDKRFYLTKLYDIQCRYTSDYECEIELNPFDYDLHKSLTYKGNFFDNPELLNLIKAPNE